ncbi:MAG: hypothetical protein ACYC66_17640 [Chloroflexota bacterium]
MSSPQSAWQRGAESIFGDNTPGGPQGQQRMFLLRLRRLLWLRRSCVGQLEDSILKVLDRSIYSTYCDCIELEVGEEARQLLKQAS